jgi:hypothetical protein
MNSFMQVPKEEVIKQMIKSRFDVELDIAGAWGYTQKEATIIQAKHPPLKQLQHNLAMMRAYIEMNMTLTSDKRYAGISVTEKSTETIKEDDVIFHKVINTITAIKEESYNKFIKEYKENYEKDGFDLAEHFQRRKKETLTRVVEHWFEVSKVI